MSDRVETFYSLLFCNGVVCVSGAELAREVEVGSAAEWVLPAESQAREHRTVSLPNVNRLALAFTSSLRHRPLSQGMNITMSSWARAAVLSRMNLTPRK